LILFKNSGHCRQPARAAPARAARKLAAAGGGKLCRTRRIKIAALQFLYGNINKSLRLARRGRARYSRKNFFGANTLFL
jgi:hypothetical protein